MFFVFAGQQGAASKAGDAELDEAAAAGLPLVKNGPQVFSSPSHRQPCFGLAVLVGGSQAERGV